MKSDTFIDIGNSITKWKFNNQYFELPTIDFEFESLPESYNIWVSNVSKKDFKVKNLNVSFINSQKKYKSLTNIYTDYGSLGSDRWLAMIALYEITHGGGFLLIDIGTAITIDRVNGSGKHEGGLIFPGLEKIRQSFDSFPVSSSGNISEIGKSTEEAWTIGTLSIVVDTINQRVRESKNILQDVPIFITGGGYQAVQKFLDFDHYYHKYLVLDGLEFFVDNMG